MQDDVFLNKKESIERCISQINKYYDEPADKSFAEDIIRQDAIAVNIQRACEQAIDLANHTIKKKKAGLPKSSSESFELLKNADIISSDLTAKLKGMVGFRNILVHQYHELNLDIMVDVIENRLADLLAFVDSIEKGLSSEVK
ncbi:MAG: type VII toxin-antitoxin system HepT family RNase toxin [Planctomycetota bacterium]